MPSLGCSHFWLFLWEAFQLLSVLRAGLSVLDWYLPSSSPVQISAPFIKRKLRNKHCIGMSFTFTKPGQSRIMDTATNTHKPKIKQRNPPRNRIGFKCCTIHNCRTRQKYGLLWELLAGVKKRFLLICGESHCKKNLNQSLILLQCFSFSLFIFFSFFLSSFPLVIFPFWRPYKAGHNKSICFPGLLRGILFKSSFSNIWEMMSLCAASF